MKFNYFKVITLGLAFALGTNLAIAQNKNVTSAGIEYKKVNQAMMSGDMEEAKKVLLNCKEYIDPAMEHESTKNDEKAHMYNGKIHFMLSMLAGVRPMDDDLEEFRSDENEEKYRNSFKKAMESRRYKRDVQDFINQYTQQSIQMASSSFENENYQMAFAGFAAAYQLGDIIDEADDEMKQNALISAQNAILKFKEKEDFEGGLEFLESTKEVFPDNTDLTIEAINFALQQNDLEKAEAYFEEAAESNPENSDLFASMGSIFLTVGDNAAAQLREMDPADANYSEVSSRVETMYEKAEKNLSRAMEIDDTNLDAAYNLGVLYLGKGEKLTMLANDMDFNDPRYDKTVEESEEMYKKAIVPLEIFIDAEPENTGVLNVLFQVHRKAGNTEQALEYKRKYEELTQE